MRRVLTMLLYLLAFFGIIYLVVKYLVPYFAPFLLAVVLAVLVEPMVQFLSFRGRVPRGVAVGVALTLILAVAGTLTFIIASRLITEMLELSRSIPKYFETSGEVVSLIRSKWAELVALLPADMAERLPEEITYAIQSEWRETYGALRNITKSALESLINAFGMLPNLMLTAVVTFVATFFLSRDRALISNFVADFVPEPFMDRVSRLRSEFLDSTVGFIKAQLTLISITTVLTTVGLYLVGSDYALLLGLVAGILDLIPLIGPTVIFVPWVLYTVLSGDTVFALKLLLVYATVGTVRQAAEAKIVGERIGVHPFATLLSVYLGLKLFGVWGFIIGPMVAIVLKAMVHAGFLPLTRGTTKGV